MEALAREPLALPTALTSAPESVEGLALVVPGFARGAALLRAEDGRLVRLSWEDGPSGDRRRGVAPGRYDLVGYRLLARDVRGVEWHVSAGGTTIRELVLTAGTETRLALDPTIELDASLAHEGPRVTVQGEAGAGLSIYRAGRRIPLRYRLRDAAGRVLDGGAFTYG